MDRVGIENDFFEGLIHTRLVTRDNTANLGRIHWKQASRTDSGVHACAQVLSFYADFPPGMKLKDVTPALNRYFEHRTPIRIWSAISVGSRFQAQRFAQFRKYLYLYPLDRLGPTDLPTIRSVILPAFVGQRNFHNFTKKVSSWNQSAIRTITHFDVSDPFEVSGREFVLFTIRGNSFMMNQIRKMLAVVLALSYNVINLEVLAEIFGETRWALSKLPGEGLMLDRVEYPSFMQNAQKEARFRDPKRDVEFNMVRPEIEAWKRDVLFPHIAALIKESRVFEQWIEKVLLVFPPMTVAEMEEQKAREAENANANP
jgi:tRNA pseudouridine38-40 synthase